MPCAYAQDIYKQATPLRFLQYLISIIIKMCYLCVRKTQGRSQSVYTLCVSTMYSISLLQKKYVEVCKSYVEVCSRAKRLTQ